MTQAEFGKLIGVERVTIGMVESGQRKVSRRLEEKLRKKLTDIDVSYIMGYTDWPNKPHSINHIPYTLIPIISKRDIKQLPLIWDNKPYLDKQDKLYTRYPDSEQFIALEMVEDRLSDHSEFSIDPGDLVICQVIGVDKLQQLPLLKYFCFITNDDKFYMGKLTQVKDNRLTLSPLNTIYDPLLINPERVSGVLKFIEVHTNRHD